MIILFRALETEHLKNYRLWIVLDFLDLSFRNAAKALSFLHLVKISPVSIWNWIQKYKPKEFNEEKKINEFVIDETVIKIGSELIWFWVAIIEPINKEILAISISKEQKICLLHPNVFFHML